MTITRSLFRRIVHMETPTISYEIVVFEAGRSHKIVATFDLDELASMRSVDSLADAVIVRLQDNAQKSAPHLRDSIRAEIIRQVEEHF